jgi:RNA polymerase sigma-70 factor (ECF subfamily)
MLNTAKLRPGLTWTVRAVTRAMQALSKQTDSHLVALALTGNRDAYGELVRRHQNLAYNAARRIVGDSQDALDVTQDAFVRAYDALGSYDRKRPFAPWLHAIVTNLALNSAKRKHRSQSLDELELRDAAATPEQHALVTEQQERVRQAVLQLPPEWRAVVELRYFQDLSYHEIAETLNLPVSDVKSHLFRARAKLKQLVERTE